jgi:PAS domain S-box-containing protein
LENAFFENHPLVIGNDSICFYAGMPIKSKEGSILGTLSVIDIEPRTLSEIQKKALKLLVGQVLALVDSTKEKANDITVNDEMAQIKEALDESAIVAITNQKGIITYVNNKFCKLSKYSKEELIGQDHRIVNSGFHSKEFMKNLWVTIANGQIWRGEVKNKSKDGSFYWVSTTIVPLFNEQGKPYQYIAIRADITAQKNAQESLEIALIDVEKRNKELDQFAYVVSHDLKAPLRAINNLSEWIAEDLPQDDEDISNNFRLLRGRVQRMENLINGVLDYSRIGRTKIEKELVDVKKLVHYIVDTLVPREGFKVIIQENLPAFRTEEILLQQVFGNLISNAIKYNDKPLGVIECRYELLADSYQFSVSDNGPGIPKQYHEKVFGVFQTIEARDVKESTGIGLAIVKKIVEEKGGTVCVESEEGAGASFIFTIPK